MQVEEQMPGRRRGRIFLALCIILFMGCTAQGVPVLMGKNMQVRCRPGALSSDCPEEQGALTAIPLGGAHVFLPSKALPPVWKKLQEYPDNSVLSEDEYGSGDETELEFGSGIDGSGFILSDLVLHQPDRDLKLRLTDDGLFPQNQQL